MDDGELARLPHPAAVPKSLRSHPPLLMAVQLAGAAFCASLSHTVLSPHAIEATSRAEATLAREALAKPLQRSLAAHYGTHALARGRQKPLGPCFRSRAERETGSHSGRGRALWRQSKRGPAKRRWCARCDLPQADRAQAERRISLPWQLQTPSKRGAKVITASVCVHCMERAELDSKALPERIADVSQSLHTALRTMLTTRRGSHRRRAPRKHKGRRNAHMPGLGSGTGLSLERRIAEKICSTAPLVPTSRHTLSQGPRARAGSAASAMPPPVRALPRSAQASLRPTSPPIGEVSQRMAALTRAVPKGPCTTRPAPRPPAPPAEASPPAVLTRKDEASQGDQARPKAPPKLPVKRGPAVQPRKTTAVAGNTKKNKVLDAMNSLGF